MDQPEKSLSENAHTPESAPQPISAIAEGAAAQARSEVIAVLSPIPERAFDRSLTLPGSLGRIDRRRQAALNAPANTRKAWKHDWQLFRTFANDHSAVFRPEDIDAQAWLSIPAPPELVSAFIDYYSPATDEQLEIGAPLVKSSQIKKPATIRRALATISKAHRIHGLEDPTKDEMVRDAAKAFFRGRAGQRQATPIHWDDVAAFTALQWRDVQDLLATANDEVLADQVRIVLRGEKQLVRAKALLLIGYNTMARREELVAFNLDDVTIGKDGDGTALIQRGKTDQAAEGHVRYLSPVATKALRAWLDVAGIRSGALFTQFQRNGQARLKDPKAPRPRKSELPTLLPYGKRISPNEVNKLFKAAMLAIGKTPAEVEHISGHSTRVGASQDLLESGMDIGAIMQSGGWKDAKMPARYTQHQQAKRSGMAKMMRDKLDGAGSAGELDSSPSAATPNLFMPSTRVTGHLSVGAVNIPFSGAVIADAGGRLTLDVDERSLSGNARVALHSYSGKVVRTVPYFSLRAESKDGHQLHSDRVSLTELGTDALSVALDEAIVTLPLGEPVPRPRMRMWLRGVRNFGPTEAITPMGRVTFGADIKGVKPDDVSGSVDLVAPESYTGSDWRTRAEEFMTFMRAGLALANGGRLHMPILEFYEDTNCHATFYEGRGHARELTVQHPLNGVAFFQALAKRFFYKEPWPDVLWVAQGWMHVETTHDELRFLSATIALEALIEALPRTDTKLLPKADFTPIREALLLTIKNQHDIPVHARSVYDNAVKQMNRRTFRESLLALLEHYDVRYDDLLQYISQLILERNHIVHRGYAVTLTWELIIVVREMITRIILKELHYEGPYQCYLGELHTRQFPACKAIGKD